MSILKPKLEQVLSRIPADVKAMLRIEGEAEERSVNQQVAHILTIWYRRGGKEAYDESIRRQRPKTST